MKRTFLLFIAALYSALVCGQPNFSVYNLSPTYSITCANPSVNLLATSASTGTYFWQSNSFTSSASSVSLTAPGVYTVSFTSGNTVSSKTLSIGTNTTPPFSNLTPTFQAITCFPGSISNVSLSSSSGNSLTTSWHSPYGGILISHSNVSVYNPGSVGIYTVTLTNNLNGCSTTKMFTVTSNQGMPLFDLVSTPGGYTLGCGGGSLTVSITNAQAEPNSGGAVGYTLLTPGSSTVLVGGLGNVNTFTISQPGNYSAVVMNKANGCVSHSQFSVLQNTVPPTVHLVPTTTISCSGSTVALTAYGPGTFTFSPSITNGVPFTITTSGTYSVSTTNTVNNCVGTATAFINVTPPLSLTLSPQNTNVCAGGTIALTASGADLYSWSGGITNGVPFTPTVSGNYSVTATNTLNGCQATSVQPVVVVNVPVISVSANAYSVCAGSSVTLTASGADTFSWTGGVSNGVPFVPTSSGTYTVTGTNTLAGCSGFATVTISMLAAAPSISVNSSEPIFCPGMSTTLSANGASNYLWSNQSTSSSIVVQPIFPTTYTVSGSSPGTCTSTVTYTLIPDTTTKFNYTISSMVVSLQLTGIGCNSFTWYIDNQPSTINPNPVITFTSSGIHSVCLQCNGLPSGCTRCFNLNVPGFGAGGVGISETYSESAVSVFPNPATDQLKVNVPSGSYRIRIFSILGIEVMNIEVNSDRNEIPLHLGEGVYLYSIYSEVTVITSGKLLVRH